MRWTPKNGGWTAAQVTLLGTDHDEAIAKKVKRALGAVRSQQVKRKIPASSGHHGGGPVWSADELRLLGTDFDEAIAARIGRTPGAVTQKREGMNEPAWQDRRREGPGGRLAATGGNV